MKGEWYKPFLVKDNNIHIAVSNGTNLSALYPVITGNDIFMSSYGFEITGKQAFDFSDFSNPFRFKQITPTGEETQWTVFIYDLPVMVMNTPNNQPINSKDVRVKDVSVNLFDGSQATSLGTAGVKGRGNATWNYEKKPYAVKFSKKQSPFGFPAHKSWVLLAEYNDRSLLRTPYMCAVSKTIGIDYTINYKHIILFLNGENKGIYLLTDKVERSSDRVAIDDSGFIIEHDGYYYQEPLFFITNLYNYGFSFKYPDADEGDIIQDDDNYLYIKNYMNSLENSLSKLTNDPEDKDFLDYIDLSSFAKYYIAAQLTATGDPNNYYVLPSRSSKLKRTPMWDAEWSLGLLPAAAVAPASLVSWDIWGDSPYFRNLVLSPTFKEKVKGEWSSFLPNINQVVQLISADSKSISKSQFYNFKIWPGSGIPLNVSFDSWEQEVDYINLFFEARKEWLNTLINSW